MHRASLVVLDESIARLAPGVGWSEGRLHDGVAPAGHGVNETGAAIVERLAAGAAVGSLPGWIDPAGQNAPERTRADVAGFLAALEAQRLISVTQSYLAEGRLRLRSTARSLHALLRLRIGLSRASYPSRRYPPTAAGILRGCARAHLPTLCLGPLLALVAVLVDLTHSSLTTAPFGGRALFVAIALSMVYVLLMPVSAGVHEFAHAAAARRAGLRVRSVFARMFVVGLSRDRGDDLANVGVAIAGPAAALAFLGAIGALVLVVALPFVIQGTAIFVLFIVAVQHTASLTPITREGLRIWMTVWEMVADGHGRRSTHAGDREASG